jgi:competence protein ComFB
MNEEALTQSSKDEFILINIVEDLVKSTVDHAMKEIDMCQCKKCHLNACAIALNSLPTKYVTTTKGTLLAEIGFMNTAFQFEVIVQVSKALKIVKEHPLH